MQVQTMAIRVILGQIMIKSSAHCSITQFNRCKIGHCLIEMVYFITVVLYNITAFGLLFQHVLLIVKVIWDLIWSLLDLKDVFRLKLSFHTTFHPLLYFLLVFEHWKLGNVLQLTCSSSIWIISS